ncbi:MAG TPA: hypothetical protein VGM72_11825 [Micropepsaceae bacterium]|jgi:hypothetical protein
MSVSAIGAATPPSPVPAPSAKTENAKPPVTAEPQEAKPAHRHKHAAHKVDVSA